MSSGYAGYAGQPMSPARSSGGTRQVSSPSGTTNLADLLERVLDKGVVIAGDITVSLGQVELLSIKIRLIVASIDKAQEIGIDWWRSDPALSSQAKQLETQNKQLQSRLDRIEGQLRSLSAPQAQGATGGQQQIQGASDSSQQEQVQGASQANQNGAQPGQPEPKRKSNGGERA